MFYTVACFFLNCYISYLQIYIFKNNLFCLCLLSLFYFLFLFLSFVINKLIYHLMPPVGFHYCVCVLCAWCTRVCILQPLLGVWCKTWMVHYQTFTIDTEIHTSMSKFPGEWCAKVCHMYSMVFHSSQRQFWSNVNNSGLVRHLKLASCHFQLFQNDVCISAVNTVIQTHKTQWL